MSEKHAVDHVGIGDVVGVAVESGRLGSSASPLHPFEEEYETKYGAAKQMAELVRTWQTDVRPRN